MPVNRGRSRGGGYFIRGCEGNKKKSHAERFRQEGMLFRKDRGAKRWGGGPRQIQKPASGRDGVQRRRKKFSWRSFMTARNREKNDSKPRKRGPKGSQRIVSNDNELAGADLQKRGEGSGMGVERESKQPSRRKTKPNENCRRREGLKMQKGGVMPLLHGFRKLGVALGSSWGGGRRR